MRETIRLVRVMEAMIMSVVASLTVMIRNRIVSSNSHIHDNVACAFFLCLETLGRKGAHFGAM